MEVPVDLVTARIQLARQEVERQLGDLPTAGVAGPAWRDYGEVVFVSTREEACQISDQYAPEHLQVLARDLDWWLARLTNYGSLFLGEETTVAFGDKASGPNHVLPTSGTARFSSPLGTYDFQKRSSLIEVSEAGAQRLGRVAAELAYGEGLQAHAQAAEFRLKSRDGKGA